MAASRNGRNVLLVAYHFPPQAGSSGLLRSLKFCRYLPLSGWSPTVLTVNSRAYERLEQTQAEEIPAQASVVRAFALDARRHLSVGGRYLRWLALPDRWATWCVGAIPAGLFAIYKRKIDVILTTFPIGTAVLIGLILSKFTRKPWVVDFRDPMTEADYPKDVSARRVSRWLERKAIRHASCFIFTAPSTLQMYLQRYPELPPEKCRLIPNGFDEEDFKNIRSSDAGVRPTGSPIRLVHAGLMYPEYRDPRPFFKALARLKEEGRVSTSC